MIHGNWAPIALLVAVAIGAINLWTILLFRIDKDRANERRPAGQTGRWANSRIPESRLLWLAALGGTPGAYVARRAFRHKTRKQPFSSDLNKIATVQIIGLVALASWQAGWLPVG